MKSYKEYPSDKNVFLFELDDILYPKKDYILQVYYLFSNFIEFTETTPDSKSLLAFMQKQYEEYGEDGMFDKIKEQFGLAEQYREKFGRIHVQAHLPLKLLLFPETTQLLHDLQDAGKNVAILTKGNPLEQLNKLKHIDWQGLDKGMKVYFIDELNFRNIDPISYIADEFRIQPEEIAIIE
ncbi:HAD hydrolase-like protein [Sphingobacterium spiritivorum]|uniref:HAD hydrolase-like protein n=1 Tax=Sphingobacterium spiritivorum TaxID=258 RepID=UPI003DA6A47B